jgi:hypothetical protein
MSGSRHDAQRRADQIRAFRAELAELRGEGVEAVAPDRYDAIVAHQDALLASLAARFDIDVTASARRLSLGMRLASAFGAAALTAAIVSFFYRIWGGLGTPAQVMLLTGAPLLALGAMTVAARRERTLYFASLCAIVGCGAFVLQTIMLGRIFNMRGSPHVLAAWAAFSLAVAVPLRLTLPFAFGVGAAVCYVAALALSPRGAPWTEFPSRPETVLVPAAAAYAAWRLAPAELRAWTRGTALVFGLGALLALSTFEASSLLPWSRGTLSAFYQVAAAAAAVAVVALGVRSGRSETLVIGAVFAGLFLVGRFVDWWWDWMPKYLFFLIMAAVAIGWLAGLARLRRRAAGGSS